MALRAYYEQNSKHDRLDRIEIYDSQFSGTAFQLTGDKTGFTFKHDIVTSETNQALLNPHANRIQVGKLDFKPFIDSSQGFTMLENIRDATGGQFTIKWVRDGSLWWQGTVTTRVFSYPERANSFIGKIRATDFDVLKGKDYPLSDNRQTLITSLADCFSQTGFSHSIVTRTSWTESHLDGSITGDYDFLNEIYHETKALRDFANTGDETDQPITYFEALQHIAEPALFIRQHNGAIYIEQLTELATPSSVVEAEYNSSGVQQSLSTVDVRHTGYKTVDNGTPVVKVSSSNDSYPGVKRAKVKYDHRTGVSNIQFPSSFTLDNSDSATYPQSFSQLFLSDGTQQISISGSIDAFFSTGYDDVVAPVIIKIDTGTTVYYWDDSGTSPSWVTSFASNNIECTDRGRSSPRGQLHRGAINITTEPTPAAADGTLTVQFNRAESLSNGYADYTDYLNVSFGISNATAQENSKSIDYQITQSGDYQHVFEDDDTWFGDGPNFYTVGALRYGSGDSQTTSDSWQRRGTTTGYRNFHENLLKEVLDLQRNNTRKLEAHIWGDYNPSKVFNYDGNYWFYAGGSYEGAYGRWKVTLMRLNIVEDSNDIFDDIPKFTDETGSGTGTTSTGGTSGGLDQSTADARYLNETNNLSDLDNVNTAITNLELDDGSKDLDLNSIDIASNPLVDSSRNVTAGTGYFSGLLQANKKSLNELSFQIQRYNFTSTLFGFGEHDELGGSSGSFGGALYHHNNRYWGISTVNKDFGNVLSSDISIYVESDNGKFVSNNDTDIGGLLTAQSGIDITGGDLDVTNNATINGISTFNSGNFSGAIRDRAGTTGNVVIGYRNDTSDTYYAGFDVNTGNFGLLNGIAAIGTSNILLNADSGDATIGGLLTAQDGMDTDGRLHVYNTGGSDAWIRFVGSDGSTNKWGVSYDFGVSGLSFYDYAGGAGEAVVFKDGGDVDILGGLLTAQGGATITGDGLTVGSPNVDPAAGDISVENNLFIEGGLFAKEFTVDTTRVMLTRRMGVGGGVIGEIVDGATGSEIIKFEDEDGNAITPVADNDLILIQQRSGLNSGTIIKSIKRKVVADGQPSNEVSLTTSGVTTGTDVGSIAVGDHAVVDGNTTNANRDGLIDVNVNDLPIPAFQFRDGRTDFNVSAEVMRVGGLDPGGSDEFDSGLSGDIGIAGKISGNLAFALTDSEGLIAGFSFDENKLSTTGLDIVGGTTPYIETSGSSLFTRLDDGTLGVYQQDAGSGSKLLEMGASIFDSQDGFGVYDSASNVRGFWSTEQWFIKNGSGDEMLAAYANGAVLGASSEFSSASSGTASALPSSPKAYMPVKFAKLDGSGYIEGVVPVYSFPDTTAPTTPGTPSYCRISPRLRIQWTGSTDNVAVSYYELQRSTSSTSGFSTIYTGSNLHFDDNVPSFNQATTYYYRVRAVDTSNNASSWSTVSGASYNGTTNTC